MKKEVDILEIIRNITAAPRFTPQRITRLLKRLDFTEKGLAIALSVQPMTVKMWVKGVSAPCAAARRLLCLLERRPSVLELLVSEDSTDE